MSFSNWGNDWDQQGESEGFIVLQDSQEVIIFEETHGSISNLEVWSSNTFNKSLEKFIDKIFQFIDLADLKNLQQLSQEHDLLVRVGEWPISQQSLNQMNGQGWVLAEEQHGTSKELFVVEVARLDLVEWDDDGLEEDDVLISEWDSKSGDDGGEDIEQLSSSIEFVVFVNKSVEAISDSFSDHFSSWDKLSIESVEYILKIFSFSGFLSIEELKEFLDEWVGDENLQGLNISSLINDKLEEEIVDGLEMWPGQINKYFLTIINTSNTFIWGISFLKYWEWSENIFFDHLNN